MFRIGITFQFGAGGGDKRSLRMKDLLVQMPDETIRISGPEDRISQRRPAAVRGPSARGLRLNLKVTDPPQIQTDRNRGFSQRALPAEDLPEIGKEAECHFREGIARENRILFMIVRLDSDLRPELVRQSVQTVDVAERRVSAESFCKLPRPDPDGSAGEIPVPERTRNAVPGPERSRIRCGNFGQRKIRRGEGERRTQKQEESREFHSSTKRKSRISNHPFCFQLRNERERRSVEGTRCRETIFHSSFSGMFMKSCRFCPVE